MKNIVRLTESELNLLIKRIIKETDGTISKTHPVHNPFWTQMISDVTGDGVETIKYEPNKRLEIDAFGTKYIITKV